MLCKHSWGPNTFHSLCRQWGIHSGPRLNIKTVFPGMEILMLKTRWSRDRLIFNMGIPILVRWHLYIVTAPWSLSLKCSLDPGVSEKHLCWFIKTCFSFVWSAIFDTWCSFTGHWHVARRWDPGSHCWSIKYTQERGPGPVDMLSRQGNGAGPATLWTATCDITGMRCLWGSRT